METDEDSDRSDSDVTSEDQEVDSAHPDNNPELTPEEIGHILMDTTPDVPATIEEVPPAAINLPNGNSNVTTVHIDVDTAGGSVRPSDLAASSPGSWPSGGPPPPTETQIAAGDVMIDSGMLRQELDEARRRTERRERDRNRDERVDVAEDDEGSDSDESMDEADNPYWANFTPDTSSPDDQELASIEETEEILATDHEHWETTAFEPLDDPEYVTEHTGRITWTVTGNHGTPDKPNRKQVMRSPSVYIGGLYWNIKYFPRGNDGTDYMSVYIECASRSYESIEEEEAEKAEAEAAAEEKIPVEEDGAERPEGSSAEAAAQNNSPSRSTSPEVRRSSRSASPDSQDAKAEEAWSAAAQVACVVYNPEEPRVYAYQHSSHQYYHGNPDWGWTRFHGPWSETHIRRRMQRKPLLQNDALGFTAYIRIFKDHTRSLWWHPSDTHPVWDSQSLLGLRGLRCREASSSAMVAAVSAWAHLTNIVKEISSFDVPDHVLQPKSHLKPVIKELQEVMSKEGLDTSSADVNLSALASMMGFFYGSEMDFRKDVINIWENLRRILNVENNLDPAVKSTRDLLDEVVMLKQPDPFNDTKVFDSYFIQSRGIDLLPTEHEPSSVQEVLDYASMHGGKAFKIWDKTNGQNKSRIPSVLQVELHRQNYDSETRKWKKLTHKVALDENVRCNGHDFTLYGMIVHRGGLDYSDYYSVLRPEGPGTRWVKYAGEGTSRSVEVLTRKSAIEAHEGGKDAEESAAVAYVVIYVRTAMISQVLSPTIKKDILQESRKRKLDQATTDTENSKTPEIIPFSVGNRLWRNAPPPKAKIYDLIRETSHLSRVFYRTEEGQFVEEKSPQETRPSEESNDASSTNEMKPEQAQDAEPSDPVSQQVTGYLKVFDPNAQTLSEPKIFKAHGNMAIVKTLKEALSVVEDEQWDFYFQQGLTVKSKNLIRRSSIFFDLSHGDMTWDGMLFIAQRHPSAEE